ncbi:MAG: DUF3090 family protein [Micromonosporaceae bacterium]|nr:DUF3090 family protein [Micromonosporaceae bacterium]
MSHQVYAFEPPDRFVVGTVGEPGERTFYLQASGGGRLVSVVLEKLQVSLLAEKLDELLGEANRRFGVPAAAEPATGVVDNDPLSAPVEEEFRVGTLGLAYDVDTSTVVIEAIEVGEEEPESESEPEPEADGGEDEEEPEPAEHLDRLRVRITPEATRAFIERARRVVAAGRPPCPLCGQPLDASGHICPRHNGYHRRPSTE